MTPSTIAGRLFNQLEPCRPKGRDQTNDSQLQEEKTSMIKICVESGAIGLKAEQLVVGKGLYLTRKPLIHRVFHLPLPRSLVETWVGVVTE